VKNYDWVELEYLFQHTRAPQINGSFTRPGVESLPEFFRVANHCAGGKSQHLTVCGVLPDDSLPPGVN
jgi:hypothetical protein